MADIYTQAGEELTTDIIDGTVVAPTWYGGWGTGAGTHVKGSTVLFTEASESRVAATMSQPVADKNRFVYQITAAGIKTITNAGIFSASSGGSLLLASDFAGLALAAGDAIEFTFDMEHT